MAKHTKGPWINRHWNERGSIVIEAPNFGIDPTRKVARCDPPMIDDGEGGMICGVDQVAETEANARLIAAAPELLAACKAVLFDHSMTWDDQKAQLFAAVNKAEGR